ncbi:MAG: hypothetical protein ACK4ND_19620 [Cytophagaceae bacterium]
MKFLKEDYFRETKGHFKCERFEIWLDNGILYSAYAPNTYLDLETAKEVVRERLKLSNGILRPVFSNITNIVKIDKEARTFFSHGDSIKLVSAIAILTTNKLQEIAGNFYINFDRPPLPTKLFISEKKALDWLEIFKHVN